MKQQHQEINNKSETSMVIRIAPEDWQITGPVNIKICQQPALIIPWPTPLAPRPPRMDVWQLEDFFFATKQQLF